MGTITVNIDDETEKRFRERVAKEYGSGKGKLGKAIGEALEDWTEEKHLTNVRKKAQILLKKGFDLGGAGKFNRKDLYDEIDKHRTGY